MIVASTGSAARFSQFARELPRAFRASEIQAKAEFLLRSRVLERISAALTREGADALLVKGAGLSFSHYELPWMRAMSDVDLLVRPGRHRAIVSLLERAGGRAQPDVDRPFSHHALESQVVFAEGALAVLVEVHTSLDKVVARRIGMRELFVRASPAPLLPGLLLPCAEDQALLVVMHAAASEFAHDVGFVDLELLLQKGLDLDALVERARAWKLETALYVCMETLRALGSTSVPPALLRDLAPSVLRKKALARYFDIGSHPVAKRRTELGTPWIVHQTPLRDDIAGWSLGLVRYAIVRAAERMWTSAERRLVARTTL